MIMPTIPSIKPAIPRADRLADTPPKEVAMIDKTKETIDNHPKIKKLISVNTRDIIPQVRAATPFVV